MRGIEPPSPAWEAGALPLSYTRGCAILRAAGESARLTSGLDEQPRISLSSSRDRIRGLLDFGLRIAGAAGVRRLAAIVLLLALIAAPGALAQGAVEPQASLPDLEDEVMCTVCGTTLQLSNSPSAARERSFINELIAEGKDKDEIKAALVDEYGTEVLAVPSAEGFDLAAWIVPIAGLLAALVTIALAVRRWRRSRPDGPPAAGGSSGPGIEPSDDRRLEADLGRYNL